MNTWSLCTDTLTAVDDCLCHRLPVRCSLCGQKATHETIVPVLLRGRLCGVACALCPQCIKANEPEALMHKLRTTYGVDQST